RPGRRPGHLPAAPARQRHRGGAEARRPDHRRRSRPAGDQRGLRRRRHRLDASARRGPGEGQHPRRRDRGRSPGRHVRRAHRPVAGALAEGRRRRHGRGRAVRWWRPGHRDDPVRVAATHESASDLRRRYMKKYVPTWHDDEVRALSELAGQFFERSVVAHREKWDAQRRIDREVWLEAGKLGLLCCSIPEEYGGGGGTFAHDLAVFEAQGYCGDYALGNSVHSGIVAHYVLEYGSEEQKKAWLPGMATGEILGAIGMTEPGTGSDLKAITTSAIRDGDHYVVNGSKTFITNGGSADMIVLAVKTGPKAGAKGVSLLIVDLRDCEGFAV